MAMAMKTTPRWMLALLFTVGIALLAGTLHGQGPAPETSQERLEAQLNRYEGFSRPSRQVLLGAPLDGVLATIHVTEGQMFDAGDKLASMDAQVQSIALEIARMQAESMAAIDAAQARLDDASTELENQISLEDRGSATDRDVRQARAAEAEAQANLTAAKEARVVAAKQVELEEERLARYDITAEFAGIVVTIQSDAGASLRQNDPVIQIVSLEPLKASINLPVSLYHELETGKTYRLRAGTPVDGELLGRLINIDRVIDPGSQTVRFTFEIDNPDSALPAGFKFSLASLEAVE